MKQKVYGEGVIIYADTREAGNRIIPILKKKCIVRGKQLKVGDYLLSDNVAVERKTTEDFIQSIIDGRLFRQISELRDVYPLSLLIIEGNDVLNTKRKIHPNAIRGAMAALAVSYSLPILWTKNQAETAYLLHAIAKREQVHNNRAVAIRTKNRKRSMNEEQEFLVAGLPKISTKMARRLLKHFGSPKKIFEAGESELMEVGGIGKETTKIIKKLLTRCYEKSILED